MMPSSILSVSTIQLYDHNTKTEDLSDTPRVMISPENLTLLQGEEETLECIVTSNPANVSVKWFHLQQELDIDGEKFSVSQSEPETFQLVIANSTASDSGEYSCSASNEVGTGTSESSALIDVICEYFIHTERSLCPSADPPSVSVSSERGDTIYVSEEAREQLTLRCNLETGHPEELESVTWYRDYQPLDSPPFKDCSVEEEFSLGEIGVEECEEAGKVEVTLLDVDRSMAGLYSCVGSNIAGEGDMSPPIQITVHCEYFCPKFVLV